jgi:AcrR family transcriptional regulator
MGETRLEKQKKMTSRALQAKKTKRQLMQNALKLIDEYGYDNVTIEDISKMTGVSVGAFYHYYSSKAEIFAGFYKKIDDYYEAKVTPLLDMKKSQDSIVLYFRHYARYITKKGIKHSRFIFETQNKVFSDKTRYMYVFLRDLIVAGQENGQLVSGCDAEHIEDYLLVVARGLIYDWNINEGAYDLEEKMRQFIEISVLAFSALPELPASVKKRRDNALR